MPPVVKSDSEPDDADLNSDYHNRWQGEKTEQSAITGFGISVWGVTLSWDSSDDEWGDASVEPETKIWAGSMYNSVDGVRTTGVSLMVRASGDAVAAGDTGAYEARARAENSIQKFEFGLAP